MENQLDKVSNKEVLSNDYDFSWKKILITDFQYDKSIIDNSWKKSLKQPFPPKKPLCDLTNLLADQARRQFIKKYLTSWENFTIFFHLIKSYETFIENLPNHNYLTQEEIIYQFESELINSNIILEDDNIKKLKDKINKNKNKNKHKNKNKGEIDPLNTDLLTFDRDLLKSYNIINQTIKLYECDIDLKNYINNYFDNLENIKIIFLLVKTHELLFQAYQDHLGYQPNGYDMALLLNEIILNSEIRKTWIKEMGHLISEKE